MSRRDIHYWKCDRPAAFHGTAERGTVDPMIENRLRSALMDHFDVKEIALRPATSQGTHLCWLATIADRDTFIRVETGPEGDGHLDMESALLDLVRATGVPTPRVHGVDASRSRVPFGWQALERIPAPDLNHWHKLGTLDWRKVAPEIGGAVATWQGIRPRGFGPCDPVRWRAGGELVGYHARYAGYFFLRLDDHLRFLAERGFLSGDEAPAIRGEIDDHATLLDLGEACLVHKDLALWNILGTRTDIAAFIDFDDTIGGDPMDDLSLLACFHGGEFIAAALAGYQSRRPVPEDFRRRFWLHLLRNLIVKAVIRVGAGYFDRTDALFLIGTGESGADLRQFTRERIEWARQGLKSDAEIESLP